MLQLIIIVANVCGPEEWTSVTLFCLDEKSVLLSASSPFFAFSQIDQQVIP